MSSRARSKARVDNVPSVDCWEAGIPADRNKEGAKVLGADACIGDIDAVADRGESEAGEDERGTHLNMVRPYSPYHNHDYCIPPARISSHHGGIGTHTGYQIHGDCE